MAALAVLPGRLAEWATENSNENLRRALADILRSKRRPGQSADTPICVIHHVVGSTGRSLRHTSMLSRILHALKETFGIEKEVPTQEATLSHSLEEWAALAAERGPTLLILDGMTDLAEYRDALRLAWMPEPKPKWRYPFQIVMTATPESLPCSSAQFRGWPIWMITPPSRDEVASIVNNLTKQWGESEQETAGRGVKDGLPVR